MGSFQSDGKAILMVFIGAIVAIAIIAIVASSIVPQTTTGAINNLTVTAPQINSTLDLHGRSLIAEVAIFNSTNASLTSTGMFLQTATGTNGLRTVQLTLNDTASGFNLTSVNVSYTFQPDGYLPDSGSRALATLILVFGALGIMVFVIVIFIKNGSMGKLIGRS